MVLASPGRFLHSDAHIHGSVQDPTALLLSEVVPGVCDLFCEVGTLREQEAGWRRASSALRFTGQGGSYDNAGLGSPCASEPLVRMRWGTISRKQVPPGDRRPPGAEVWASLHPPLDYSALLRCNNHQVYGKLPGSGVNRPWAMFLRCRNKELSSKT